VLGGVLTLALVALGAGIFLLDDILARFRSVYAVVAVLPEAPRLAAGARVWVGGNDVGEVRTVALIQGEDAATSRVALELLLPGRVREQVRGDSRVRVTAVSMMSAPVIDILPGTSATPALAPGDTLYPAPGVDREALRARALAVRLALDSALAELRGLQPPLQRRLQAMAQVQLQLTGAEREYTRLMSDLRASPLLTAWQSGELGATLAHSSETLSATLSALQQLQQRAGQSGLAAGTAGLTARAGALQQALASLQSAMRERGGTLDRMARDSALVRALASARMELDSLLADARRNPWRYVF